MSVCEIGKILERILSSTGVRNWEGRVDWICRYDWTQIEQRTFSLPQYNFLKEPSSNPTKGQSTWSGSKAGWATSSIPSSGIALAPHVQSQVVDGAEIRGKPTHTHVPSAYNFTINVLSSLTHSPDLCAIFQLKRGSRATGAGMENGWL